MPKEAAKRPEIATLLLMHSKITTKLSIRAVVVAQLVEQSLPKPEVRGLNSVISKKIFILNICLLSTVY